MPAPRCSCFCCLSAVAPARVGRHASFVWHVGAWQHKCVCAAVATRHGDGTCAPAPTGTRLTRDHARAIHALDSPPGEAHRQSTCSGERGVALVESQHSLLSGHEWHDRRHLTCHDELHASGCVHEVQSGRESSGEPLGYLPAPDGGGVRGGRCEKGREGVRRGDGRFQKMLEGGRLRRS